MDVQDEYNGNDDFRPEILAVLQDLTRLLHHNVSARVGEPAIVASMLLERLQQLCQASRGAIFLTSFHVGDKETMITSPAHNKAYRSLALHGVKEEEIYSLLSLLPEETLWTSQPDLHPFWLVWRLPLVLSFSSLHDESVGYQEQNDDIVHVPQALLLLGWDGQNEEQRVMLMKQGCHVLPAIADAVGAVIVRTLANEYIYELEAHTDRKALHEMELLKAELLASVSHELRSPLTSIKGYASTLLRHERRISREERHEFLLAINQASDRLAGVIDSLLEMSDLETGRIEIKRMPVDLVCLVSEAVIVAEQTLEEPEETASPAEMPVVRRPHTFEVLLRDSNGKTTADGLIIQADLNRLREVLDHLLENAVNHASVGGNIRVLACLVLTPEGIKNLSEFSYDGGVKLKTAQLHYQHMAVICVQDDGKGIPGVFIQRIFDPFYRVDTRLTREVNGLGLGLTICQRIIELHNGIIWAESEVGKGSTFFVCLPMDDEEASSFEHH